MYKLHIYDANIIEVFILLKVLNLAVGRLFLLYIQLLELHRLALKLVYLFTFE